jgi:FAD:protein FMN transferase
MVAVLPETLVGVETCATRPIRRAEPVMGTVVSFDVRPGELAHRDVLLALSEARRRLHRADAVFSTWKTESPVSRLRRGEVDIDEMPEEVAEVLDRCLRAKDASGGWFDPWAAPGGVDPTGLVKGWAAIRALDALLEAGVSAAMVSAAGDIAVCGEPQSGRPWRIGIQDPWDRMGLLGVVEVRGAVATSGTYERGSHIFDPTTGATEVPAVAATVVGPELDLADALATGLVAGGAGALGYVAALERYEGLVVMPDRSFLTTAGFAFL